MTDNKQLVVLPSVDDEWAEIVDALIAELDESELPDKVVRATELLLAGYPVYQVARKLKTSTETVRRWISTYPTMAMVLANGRKLLSKWRMAKLEQQFLTAVERSHEVLEIPLDGEYTDADGKKTRVNPKILTVIAAQARYIIGLFAGQKLDITVTHEFGDTVMNAQKDALDYLAERLREQEINAEFEPVETVVRVIDEKMDNQGPFLDENGNPPFGKMGVLDVNDDGILCHICGRRFKSLARHLLTAHTTPTEDYEMLYMLPEGAVRKTERGKK